MTLEENLDRQPSSRIASAKGIIWLCVVGIIAAMVGFALLVLELGNRERLGAVEAADPCVSLSQAVSNRNHDRVPALTKDCKDFLSELSPLVTIKLSCAIIEKARYVCPAPGTRPSIDNSGGASEILGPTLPTNLEGSAAGQQEGQTKGHRSVPESSQPNGNGESEGRSEGHHQGHEETSTTQPAPSSAAAPVAPASPLLENPATVQAKACAHVVLGTCVDLTVP